MPILKKLLLTEWIKAFLGAFFVLFLVLTVANLISGFLRGNVSSSDVLANYLIELPGHLNKIFPISCLVASLFSINKLKNRNELVAILASGYNRKSIIFTIIQISFFIGLLQFFISSYIEPLAKSFRHTLIDNSESKFRNLKSKGLRASTIGSGKIWYRSQNYFFSFKSFEKNTNTLNQVQLYFFNDKHLLTKQINAAKMIHLSDENWTIINGTEISSLDKSQFSIPQVFERKEISIQEQPNEFKQVEADITTLNVVELTRYVAQLSTAGINTNEYSVLILNKFSSAIVCVIFALVSSIGIFNPNRRNSNLGKSLVFIFVFTLSYWLIHSYLLELGVNSKISPFFATFTVPFIFLLGLMLFYVKNRKISS